VQLRVVSQSMAPFLKVGDMVLVEPMASDSPAFNVRRGDVIVVRRAGELITHRLVSMGKETCLTKGDRNRFMDPPIAHQAILGKVIAVERNGRVRRLNDFPWVRLNRLFGYYGWWQARLFASTRRLWHRYFQ
jgi:signal peptidase I